MKPFDGKVAVVTGGVRGMGRATCKAYTQAGTKIAVEDVLMDDTTATAHENGSMAVAMDVADPCVFLASDDARCITAQTLNVDGGNWMS